MSNHQEAGIEDFLGLMTQSHPVRFSEKFWQVFTERVEPKLPANPQIVDLGSGPGLFLQELSERLPAGKLRGYDVNDEMLKYARALPIPAGRAKFSAVDLASEMPQLPPAQTDLVTMNFSFHIFDYPVPILKWIKSVLKPRTGIFMHYGWVRSSLPEYLTFFSQLASRLEKPDVVKVDEPTQYTLYARHNKYTVDDLRWLFETDGLKVNEVEQITKFHSVLLSRVA